MSDTIKASKHRRSVFITVSVIAAAALCIAAINLATFFGQVQKTAGKTRTHLTWEQVELLATGELGYQDITDSCYYEDTGSAPHSFTFPIADTDTKAFSLVMTFDGVNKNPAAIRLYNQADNQTLELNTENLGTILGLPSSGVSADSDNSEQDEKAIRVLVQDFGKKLQFVMLSDQADEVLKSMQKNYGKYVSPALVSKWLSNLKSIPGRTITSIWPDRINILSLLKNSMDEYTVKGEIIEITSAEQSTGEAASKRPITMDVRKINGHWVIDGATLGSYTEPGLEAYENTQYGFRFSLPESWKGYTIITGKWEGRSMEDTQNNAIVETGPQFTIRNPKWTEENPRQDIPILVFTHKQWESLKQEKFSIGAAPIGPSELGENANYVYALPARYDWAALTGYEEVHEIIDSNPLLPK